MPVADSVDTVLHLTLALWRPERERWPAPRPTATERETLTLVLQDLRAGIAMPRALAMLLNSHSRFDSDGDTTRSPRLVHPSLDGRLVFTLHANGRITDLAFEERSISEPLDAALVAMLQRDDPPGVFWNIAHPLAQDSVRLLLTTTHSPGEWEVSTPLMRMRMPRYPATPVRVFKALSPRYPDAGLRAGVVDTVQMRFVVDTLGRVDMATAYVWAAHYREFVSEVRRVLPRLRFEPMRIAGCPTRQLVQQPFVFSI
ncbi:MAG TPA: energy transducer TonB, partial [Gemmatimonadaceae bacterium]|nr:energy transducer TonB [Gemmatimonadaceae bacterium]